MKTAPPAGYQRMRIGQIVDFLFDFPPKAIRESKRRLVYNWVRHQRLRAQKVEGMPGFYDVDIESLTLLRATIRPSADRG